MSSRAVRVEGATLVHGHAHPEVSVHTPSLEEYMQRIYRGDWEGVGEMVLSSARKLAAMGADFLICPDNTLHQALPYVVPRSRTESAQPVAPAPGAGVILPEKAE